MLLYKYVYHMGIPYTYIYLLYIYIFIIYILYIYIFIIYIYIYIYIYIIYIYYIFTSQKKKARESWAVILVKKYKFMKTYLYRPIKIFYPQEDPGIFEITSEYLSIFINTPFTSWTTFVCNAFSYMVFLPVLLFHSLINKVITCLKTVF